MHGDSSEDNRIIRPSRRIHRVEPERGRKHDLPVFLEWHNPVSRMHVSWPVWKGEHLALRERLAPNLPTIQSKQL
jgi:hypothetical protein